MDVDEVPSSHDDWALALSVLDSRIEWRPNGGRDHIFFFALYNSLSGSVPASRTRGLTCISDKDNSFPSLPATRSDGISGSSELVSFPSAFSLEKISFEGLSH